MRNIKNIVLSVVIMSSLVGCAAIMKQFNLMGLMEHYVFNKSAEEVYAGAVHVLDKKGIHLESTGKHRGESHWETHEKKLGEVHYDEKARYVVTVSDRGDHKSTLKIMHETESNLGGHWNTATPSRVLVMEHDVLLDVDPAGAAALDRKAAKM